MAPLRILAVVALVAMAASLSQAAPQFGKSVLANFSLAPGYINLNHGSFGTAPKPVTAARNEWYARMDASPDLWFRWDVYTSVYQVLARVAQYINCDAEDVVLVENASHGVNAVLRSIPYSDAKHKILYLNTAYQMVKNVLSFLQDTKQEDLLMLNITFPTSADAIVALVSEALEKNSDIGLAVFSHITSVPALILPVEQLVQVCHKHGVMVFLDGAHAMGQIPIDMKKIGADFYTSNGHKWLYSPKGSAILYVAKDKQDLIYPPAINDEGQGPTHFQLAFSYQGTYDYSAYLAMGAAIDFRNSFGDAAIMDYMHDLACKGGDQLVALWGTEKLVDDSLIGAMVNVRLPTDNATAVTNLPQQLLQQYNTWVPAYALQGKYYVRVSAQIYNDLSDFVYLGRAVLALLKQ